MVTRLWRKLVAAVTILIVLTLVLTMVPACAPTPTPEKPIELTFAIWCGPAAAHSRAFEAWAKDLEESSGGRVKVNLAWSEVMGKASEHFEMARSGIADVATFVIPYAPGTLPMSTIMTCPLSVPSAEVGSKAYFELYKKGYLDEEFAGVEPMFLWTTGPYHFYWADEPVRSLADIKGKKIRAPGGGLAALPEVLGAVPVSIASPEVYTSLQKKIIDGALFTGTGVTGYNLQEVCKYVTKLEAFVVPFGVFMNKGVYEGLPKDIREMIGEWRDSNKYGILAAQEHDKDDAEAWELMASASAEISNFSETDRKEIGKLFLPMWEKWITDNEAKGLPVEEASRDLFSILKNLGVTDPLCGYTP